MRTVVRVIEATVLLALAAFIIMVACGVFTALNAAPGYTFSTSVEKSSTSGGSQASNENLAYREMFYSKKSFLGEE